MKSQKHSDKVPENLVECPQEVDAEEFPNITKNNLLLGVHWQLAAVNLKGNFAHSDEPKHSCGPHGTRKTCRSP